MTIILGELEYNDFSERYNKDSKRSKHYHNRKHRIALCSKRAGPLYYFEVYREIDNKFQIHCIYEDASLLIFNKEEEMLITLILLNVEQVKYYLEKIGEDINEHMQLIKSAQLNKKLPRNIRSLSQEEIHEIVKKKDKYIAMG